MSQGHPRASKKWIADLLIERFASKPSYRASDMVKDIERDVGLVVPYHQAWNAKELAIKQLHGDVRTSYDMLRWYSQKVIETNPGSILDLQVDEETHRFKRFFVCFHACSRGYEVGCRAMIFLDDTHVTAKTQGVILAASALNGNNELFTLAYAITATEDTNNWEWFLINLKRALHSDRPNVFISDRAKGLVDAIPAIFPNSHHAYCLWHIEKNFITGVVGKYCRTMKKNLCHILKRIAYAVTEEQYTRALTAMETNSRDAKDWVLRNNVEYWSNALFQGDRYGELYSNLAESFNAWIKEARGLPILQMVDTIRLQIMQMAGDRKKDSSTWTTTLCPRVEKEVLKNLEQRRGLHVIPSDGFHFEVLEGIKTFAVDLHDHECSCHYWQLLKFPCKHACAAIAFNRQTVYDYVSPFYSSDMYRAAYEETIQPVPSCDMPEPLNPKDVVIKPPLTKKLPGRPKKKRILSRGEVEHVYVCSRCKQEGHNRRTCTFPIQYDDN